MYINSMFENKTETFVLEDYLCCRYSDIVNGTVGPELGIFNTLIPFFLSYFYFFPDTCRRGLEIYTVDRRNKQNRDNLIPVSGQGGRSVNTLKPSDPFKTINFAHRFDTQVGTTSTSCCSARGGEGVIVQHRQ